MRASGDIGSRFAMGASAFIGGCVLIALNAVFWYSGQFSFLPDAAQTSLALILRFFSAEILGLLIVILGALLMYKGIVGWKTGGQAGTVRVLLSDTLASPKDLRVGILSGLAYGIAYLFVSGTVVFQPLVNFATAYGISGSELIAVGCCGAPGALPSVVGYLPQAHIGVQLVPFNLLFATTVPILVGFNSAVAARSLRNKAVRKNLGLVGSLGSLIGLFTGCPTCAALSFAGAVGGIGASAVALALAPYQTLFVAVSIPVLVVSPLMIAYYANRAELNSCPV